MKLSNLSVAVAAAVFAMSAHAAPSAAPLDVTPLVPGVTAVQPSFAPPRLASMRQMSEAPVPAQTQPVAPKQSPSAIVKPQDQKKSTGKQVLVSEEREFIAPAEVSIVQTENHAKPEIPDSRAAAPAAAFDSVINARQGEPAIVAISTGKLNRLVSPFDEVVVDTLSKRVQIKHSGGVVMVATKSHEPIDIIIRDAENPANAVMLTLDPQPNIPARDVRINASFSGSKGGSVDDPENETAHPAAVRLKNIMRYMAKGDIPSGYAMKRGNQSPARCDFPGLQTREAQVLNGSGSTIRVYAAKNISAGPVELDERGCSARNQLAAAVWPRLVLQSGESTELYVIEAPVREASKASIRPPVID